MDDFLQLPIDISFRPFVDETSSYAFYRWKTIYRLSMGVSFPSVSQLSVGDRLRVFCRYKTSYRSFVDRGPSKGLLSIEDLLKPFLNRIPLKGLPLDYWQHNAFCKSFMDGSMKTTSGSSLDKRPFTDLLSKHDLLRTSGDSTSTF